MPLYIPPLSFSALPKEGESQVRLEPWCVLLWRVQWAGGDAFWCVSSRNASRGCGASSAAQARAPSAFVSLSVRGDGAWLSLVIVAPCYLQMSLDRRKWMAEWHRAGLPKVWVKRQKKTGRPFHFWSSLLSRVTVFGCSWSSEIGAPKDRFKITGNVYLFPEYICL